MPKFHLARRSRLAPNGFLLDVITSQVFVGAGWSMLIANSLWWLPLTRLILGDNLITADPHFVIVRILQGGASDFFEGHLGIVGLFFLTTWQLSSISGRTRYSIALPSCLGLN